MLYKIYYVFMLIHVDTNIYEPNNLYTLFISAVCPRSPRTTVILHITMGSFLGQLGLKSFDVCSAQVNYGLRTSALG